MTEWSRALQADYLFLVAIGYALLTIAVCAFEVRRTRGSGPDAVTVFVVIFVLQCCLPGVVLFASLPFVDPLHPTGTDAFDQILSRVDVVTGLLVLGLTAWFAFFFYAFTALMGNLLRRLGMQWPASTHFVVSGAPARLLGVIALGAVLTSVSFWLIGDSMLERYANLILFRQYSDDVDRTLLSNYAFSLTQSWAWLSVPALFVIYESRGRSLSWYLCLGCVVVFAALGVSRRSLFIPMLLAYLALVLFDGRWRLKWVMCLSLPVLLWIGFGKEFFSATAAGVSLEEVSGRYSSVASALVRTSCDIGITLMESLGTVNLLDLDTRFGVDHLLSLLRRIPVGWFGYDSGLPERVVRLSTEAFASADDQDIPPGLFGQMWLDFGILGPALWAGILAVQVAIVQRVFAWTILTRQASAAFALAVFVVALPLNSGSFDFTFSVDIFVLLAAMLFTFRLVRVRMLPISDAPEVSMSAAVPPLSTPASP